MRATFYRINEYNERYPPRCRAAPGANCRAIKNGGGFRETTPGKTDGQPAGRGKGRWRGPSFRRHADPEALIGFD